MAIQVSTSELRARALTLALDSIRATTAAHAGHPTSALSCAELCSVLFFSELQYDVQNPDDQNNDRFILSKGHAVPVVYAAYKQLGAISDAELLTLRQENSELEGHPTPRFVYHEAATGSLGQGLAVGVGMALYAQRTNKKYRTYVLLGDGEMAEGSVWEALHAAAYHKLSNIVVLVDVNRLGQSQETAEGHHVEQYASRIKAFGWETISIDGHNVDEISAAFKKARTFQQPVAIIAHTYKGHGLEGMEDKLGFHGRPLTADEASKAIAVYEQKIKSVGCEFPKARAFERPKALATQSLPDRKSVV